MYGRSPQRTKSGTRLQRVKMRGIATWALRKRIKYSSPVLSDLKSSLLSDCDLSMEFGTLMGRFTRRYRYQRGVSKWHVLWNRERSSYIGKVHNIFCAKIRCASRDVVLEKTLRTSDSPLPKFDSARRRGILTHPICSPFLKIKILWTAIRHTQAKSTPVARNQVTLLTRLRPRPSDSVVPS